MIKVSWRKTTKEGSAVALLLQVLHYYYKLYPRPDGHFVETLFEKSDIYDTSRSLKLHSPQAERMTLDPTYLTRTLPRLTAVHARMIGYVIGEHLSMKEKDD
tara:strand:- start:252 stop:557 length:306 start_codon:yes stop_codon:yes gene_type:complete